MAQKMYFMKCNVSLPRKGQIMLGILGLSVLLTLYWARTDQFSTSSRPQPLIKSQFMSWTWVCDYDQCVRHVWNSTTQRISLATCRMQCGPLPIWPLPTGKTKIGPGFTQFCANQIKFVPAQNESQDIQYLLGEAIEIFHTNVKNLIPEESRNAPCIFQKGSKGIKIKFNFSGNSPDRETYLTLYTNEGYRLVISKSGQTIRVTIASSSFFGIRNGLETLSQLIWYDENDKDLGVLRIISKALVNDKPKFAYRGIMIDTSRNFLPVSSILATINGMSASKLNTLHVHLTDSQSFPFDSMRVPNMAKYGAYSSKQIYSTRDMGNVVEYARVRGVRIILEIDTPAHAGAGWQWGPDEGLGQLHLCYNYQPWSYYCGEPPCGQLNPVNNNTYIILKQLYEELLEITHNKDVFHIGGDEVNLNCWASSRDVIDSLKNLTHEDLMRQWGVFTKRALTNLKDANRGSLPNAVIIWSSDLTKPEYVQDYIDKKVFVVQSWGASTWPDTPVLLDMNYRIIISHVDAWYLDCGFGSWRGPGPGSCNPVSSWQNVYQHRPWWTLSLPKRKRKLILGGEACLWAEQVDKNNLDMKLWPRAAALAERLWSDPEKEFNVWIDPITTKDLLEKDPRELNLRDAHARISHHNERLASRGVRPDSVWPQWCQQNPFMCLDINDASQRKKY